MTLRVDEMLIDNNPGLLSSLQNLFPETRCFRVDIQQEHFFARLRA
jgi:hypothetical protein